MKKFLLSIFAVMLAVFSVQAETKTYTYDFSKNTYWVKTKGGSTAVSTGSGNKLNAFYDKATGDVFNAGGKGYFNSGYFLWGKSGAYIELPTYSGEKITKVTAKSSSGVSANVTVGVYNGTNSVAKAVKWAKSTSYDYDIPEAYQSSVLRLQVTNDYNAQIVSITITTETTGEGGGETPVVETVATPTFNPADGATFEESLSVTISSATEGATIHYTLNRGTEQTGVSPVTVTVTETTEVVAFATKTSCTDSDKATATYTKVVPVDPNAKEFEATISFASTAQRVSQDANKQVWANGGVTFTNNKASSSSNVANYSNPVRLYAGSNVVVEHEAMKKIVFVCNSTTYATNLVNSIGEAATVSGSDVTVTFINPVDEFTIEKLTKQVQLKSLTVTYITTEKVVKSPVITPESCGFYAGENVEVAISAEEGTIYYTLDGTDPTTISDKYIEPFIVGETTIVKAIAVVDGTASEVTTAVYTKGIEGSVADALAAYVDGEKLPAVVTGYIVGFVNGSTAGDAGENCVFDVAEEMRTNILIANDPYETDYMKCLAVQLPGNDIRAALNLVDNPDNLNKKVVIKGSLEKYLGIAAIKEIVIGELVEEPSYTLTVGETEWATLCLDAAVVIPDGVDVYTVREIKDGYVELGEVSDVIPADCPVLVKASWAGEWDFVYTSETGDEYVNLLKGTAVATYITDDAYVLTADDTSENGVCFGRAIKNQLDGTAWLNNANKAYLPASAVEGAQNVKSLGFQFGEGTTGVEEVKTENGEVKTIYDLTGRKLKGENGNLKGVYIVNGKKVLVK